MDEVYRIPWFAGLFEGEGTFVIVRGKAKRLSVTSTDRDVLERIKNYFDGAIYNSNHKKAKENWKQAYVWHLAGEKAIELVIKIKPFLLHRRAAKAEVWLNSYKELAEKINKRKLDVLHKRADVISLRKDGLTHDKIAAKLGYDRTTVSKILKMVGIA